MSVSILNLLPSSTWKLGSFRFPSGKVRSCMAMKWLHHFTALAIRRSLRALAGSAEAGSPQTWSWCFQPNIFCWARRLTSLKLCRGTRACHLIWENLGISRGSTKMGHPLPSGIPTHLHESASCSLARTTGTPSSNFTLKTWKHLCTKAFVSTKSPRKEAPAAVSGNVAHNA